MIPVAWKGRWALWGRVACMGMLNCTVGRRLRGWLRHWNHISVPEGLYTGIVGVCVIIFHIWICRPTTTTLLVSGPLLSQLRMPCFDPFPLVFHPLKLMITQNV